MATRYAKIPEIKEGVVFSDPWYEADVWCQYRQAFKAKDWLMQFTSRKEDGLVYFEMKLGRPTASRNVSLKDGEDGNYKISYPGYYDLKSVELGMDTACIFCGNMENWNTFGESGALRTGTDGMFGDLMVFTCKGEEEPAGFLLMGVLDDMFGNEEDIFKHLNASFNGQEISKEQYTELSAPAALRYQVYAAMEAGHARKAQAPTKEPTPDAPER